MTLVSVETRGRGGERGRAEKENAKTWGEIGIKWGPWPK